MLRLILTALIFLTGLFDLFMGQHLAAAGGFGMAAALDRHLRTPSYAADHRSPPAGGTVAGPTGR